MQAVWNTNVSQAYDAQYEPGAPYWYKTDRFRNDLDNLCFE